jgi:hypothetical protein
MWNHFFSKNSEWQINQNGDFFTDFLRCSNFVCRSFMSNFFFILIDFLIQKNIIIIFEHENSKWHPNLRWTSKRFY